MSLRIFAGSSESWFLGYAISTKVLCAGSHYSYWGGGEGGVGGQLIVFFMKRPAIS